MAKGLAMTVPPAEETPTTEETPLSLLERWASLTKPERIEIFKSLPRQEAEELFLNLHAPEQAELFVEFTQPERRSWIRLLAPDDIADLLQILLPEERPQALALLDDFTRKEVTALLAYAEDEAGGLMSSRYIRLRPDMSADEAIHYLRAQAKTQAEVIYYAYVLDHSQKLLGVVSFRQLLLAPPHKAVREIMQMDVVTIPEDMDQEEVSKKFAQCDLMAIPVIDEENRMKGIITVDDVVDVVKEEATEDIQKLGGMEALDAPYLQIDFREMLKKRAGWMVILFVGEMFTATAMGHYESQISKAIVLTLFIPLIISSGGNSGSQASTLIIRSLAVGEVRLTDWSKIFFREIRTGLILGAILGSIGFFRILLWPSRSTQYGEHYMIIAVTVAVSVMGVVLWGALAGSMLPLVLSRLGFDPASASAPLVATLVDVTGLVIYFSVAQLFLGGILI